MVTEGTYPQSFGGVSVWCDQILRGLPDHHFDVHAISVTGTEPMAWQPPANVTVHPIPLWPPGGGPRGGRPWWGRTGRRGPDPIAAAYRDLLRSLVAPADDGVAAFTDALRRLCELFAAPGTPPLPRDEAAVGWLLEAWGDSKLAGEVPVAPSVLDALVSVDIIGHWLRPLLRPAPVADVSHAVTNGLAVLVALAAKWTHGTPLLLTEHGVYLRERYLGLRDSPYSWPVKAVLVSFQRLLCATAYQTADLITPGNRYNHRWEVRFGAEPARIQTVYNGVDPGHFPPAGPEPTAPTITWAGRIDPIKDLETLLRAFALVRAELPAAKLRIFGGTAAGSRGYHDRCRVLAAELGVADAVGFEGRVENIRDAYAAGHVVVLSSISEGFPYTLIEAMTSGRATVSTDVGGVAEAVDDTGLVVPPRDPPAMAEACLRLLRDEEWRHRLGEAARTRALELFTVDRAVDAFEAIYTDLATGRHVESPALVASSDEAPPVADPPSAEQATAEATLAEAEQAVKTGAVRPVAKKSSARKRSGRRRSGRKRSARQQSSSAGRRSA